MMQQPRLNRLTKLTTCAVCWDPSFFAGGLGERQHPQTAWRWQSCFCLFADVDVGVVADVAVVVAVLVVAAIVAAAAADVVAVLL